MNALTSPTAPRRTATNSSRAVVEELAKQGSPTRCVLASEAS
ncbi:hypothetical protein O1L55_39345 [Streptomyces albulus]|nr:hypothetical protein [Streptomyces noursei]